MRRKTQTKISTVFRLCARSAGVTAKIKLSTYARRRLKEVK